MKYQVMKVASSQSAIGWDNALKGFVSKDWTELAACHLTDPEVCDISKARNQMKLLYMIAALTRASSG